MVVTDASPSNTTEFANVVQDIRIGLLLHSAVMTHLYMILACLQLTQMFGTLTVVLPNILPRNVASSPLLSLPLQGILSHVPITPLILLREWTNCAYCC